MADPPQRPLYAQKARIVEGNRLYRQLPHGTTIESIADIARCHPNTVRTALDGRRVQYGKAHGVFTALNVVSHDAFSRFEHVEVYEDGSDQPQKDPALKHCAVLHRAPDLLRDSKLKIQAVADDAGVHYLEASSVISSGKPALRTVVEAVFRVFQGVNPALNANDEIVG